MKKEYIVNAKSIVHDQRIKQAIANNDIPLSLFRAAGINMVRDLLAGNHQLVDVDKLEKAMYASIANYERSNRNIRTTDLKYVTRNIVGAFRRCVLVMTKTNIHALKHAVGFTNVTSIKNSDLLFKLIERRIFKVDDINKIEGLIFNLNGLISQLDPNKTYCLDTGVPNVFIKRYDLKVDKKLMDKHSIPVISSKLTAMLKLHGIKTMNHIGLTVKHRDSKAMNGYYDCIVQYKNVAIPCRISSSKQGEPHEHNESV